MSAICVYCGDTPMCQCIGCGSAYCSVDFVDHLIRCAECETQICPETSYTCECGRSYCGDDCRWASQHDDLACSVCARLAEDAVDASVYCGECVVGEMPTCRVCTRPHCRRDDCTCDWVRNQRSMLALACANKQRLRHRLPHEVIEMIKREYVAWVP